MIEPKARVLIVDDDEEIRNVLGEYLGQRHNCVALDAADKALALLRTQPFDLIMSDIAMAPMSGLEMLPYVSALAPESVVVMVSGERTIDFAIRAMRAGAFDYITKPFELAEVDTVVRRALAHRNSRLNFRPGTDASALQARELRKAVVHKQFVVHYQPQVDMRTLKIVGAEALVRWQHPRVGLLLPADFIPLAENTGAIVHIGALVLRSACAEAKTWQETGFDSFRIAVNVSPQQLREKYFPESVAETLIETNFSPTSLELEVTETSLMQNSESGIQTLARLHEMGVRIAIDDFGTGYSSLCYLKKLPIDSVKIDPSFVKDATTDPDDAALVLAIITLAHNLGKKVIAEGIEREDQLALLKLLRCDEAQGYLISKPGPPEEITPLLMNDGREVLTAVA